VAAASAAVVALACEGGAPPSRGAPGARPSGPPPGERAEAPPRRGDRHARAAARSGRPLHEVSGTVVRAEDGRVAIRPRDGPEVTLRIGPRTTVTTPGRGAATPGRAPVAPGDEVRASWRSGGDPPTALSVEVRSGPDRDPWTDRG
jgi:hypothetical protein